MGDSGERVELPSSEFCFRKEQEKSKRNKMGSETLSTKRMLSCQTPPRTPRRSPPASDGISFGSAGEICQWCSNALPTELKEVFGAKPQGLAEVKEYTYTTGEGFANFITHFVCIPGAALAFYKLCNATNTFRETAVVSIYASLMMTLFLVSTIYHLVFLLEIGHSCIMFVHKIRPWRRFLLLLDRSVVHLFIAGCYTPWLILRDHGPMGTYMCQAMWAATITGVIIQHTQLISRNDRLIFIYLIIGVLPGTFMVVCMTDSSGLLIIGAGGLAYLIGLLFFFSDGKVPYAHAIWHCFVIVGVYLHYRAMVDYLLRERVEMPPTPSTAYGRLMAPIFGLAFYIAKILHLRA